MLPSQLALEPSLTVLRIQGARLDRRTRYIYTGSQASCSSALITSEVCVPRIYNKGFVGLPWRHSV